MRYYPNEQTRYIYGPPPPEVAREGNLPAKTRARAQSERDLEQKYQRRLKRRMLRYYQRVGKQNHKKKRCVAQMNKSMQRSRTLLGIMQQTYDQARWARYNQLLQQNRVQMWKAHQCLLRLDNSIRRKRMAFWRRHGFDPGTRIQDVSRFGWFKKPKIVARANPKIAPVKPKAVLPQRLPTKRTPLLSRTARGEAPRKFATPPPQMKEDLPEDPDFVGEDKKNPAPATKESTWYQPSKGFSEATVEAWNSYCNREKKRYQPVTSPQFLSHKKHGAWQVSSFDKVLADELRPLFSGGRFVSLGQGGRYSLAHCEDRPQYLWDTKKHLLKVLRPPVTAFLQKHPSLVPWFKNIRLRSVSERLLFYKPSIQQAGILLKTPLSKTQTKRYRYFYLRWNLSSNKIDGYWELGGHSCSGAYMPVSVSSDHRYLYYFKENKKVNGSCVSSVSQKAIQNRVARTKKLMRLELKTSQRASILQFTHHYKLERVLANHNSSKIAVIEYTELKDKKGSIYLLDTQTKRVQTIRAPYVPYGSTFTPDKRSLLVYGAKNGVLFKISLTQVGKVEKVKAWRRGHAMGLSKDGSQLYLLHHSGAQIRSLNTLKTKGFLSHRKVIGKVKFLHVDGSVVSGGTIFIKNGEKLYIRSLL